jgi:cytochrome o ubiquinol oxidase subunit 1
MVTFVLGGFSGIILAIPPLDFQVHNTVFLVAHFHNMLIPGVLYGLLAGYHYWFPKAFGFRLDERWGRIALGCWVAGFYLAFMPLYVLGLSGMVRRTQEIFEPAFRPWLLIALCGALLLLCALGSLLIQLWVSIRNRAHTQVFSGDPWDGRGLEWSLSAPPPEYAFAVIPQITSRDPFFDAKQSHTAYPQPSRYQDIEVPRNSATGLVWHIWWVVILGVVSVWAAVIARSFARNVHRTISASEVERIEARWLRAIAEALPVSRMLETTRANQGLAKVPS